MGIKNDEEGMIALRDLILSFYGSQSRAVYFIFSVPTRTASRQASWEYLLDRKQVVRYSIGESDRGSRFLGAVEIAIGPYFFGPVDFWSYENSERFRMGTDPSEIQLNLTLLDEFLGRSGLRHQNAL